MVSVKRSGGSGAGFFARFINVQIRLLSSPSDPFSSGTVCNTYTKNEITKAVATVACSPGPIIGTDVVLEQKPEYWLVLDIAEVYVYRT